MKRTNGMNKPREKKKGWERKKQKEKKKKKQKKQKSKAEGIYLGKQKTRITKTDNINNRESITW